MFKSLNFAGGTVAGHHDLFVRFVERVEGVKKFFLKAFFAGKKPDVVNQQYIRLEVFFAECDELVVLNRVNEFAREFFG